MRYTQRGWFQHVCRLVLFFFTFATFHPATLGVSWKIDISFDPQTWNLKLGTWNWEFGLTPASGFSQ